MEIVTADYHTAGEPYRIVTGGVEVPPGRTVLDRRSWAQENLDRVRKLLINEPRGHADMYGCFVTPPDDDGAEFGMVFFHKDGFSTACGHGTIAGATWALDSGLVSASEPDTRFCVDVPSGRVEVTASIEAGQVVGVRFTNVPSWVAAKSVRIELDGRDLDVDVSYGGAFYASCDVGQLGLNIESEHLDELIRLGRKIKWAVNDHPAVRHPDDDRLSGCYGTIWYQAVGPLHQRNVTIFADGEVDRSPCGSGTSARLALLEHDRELATDQELRHESIIGTVFTGRVVRVVVESGVRQVITEVGGRAFPTGHHRFVLHPDDPVGTGFQLR
ncbi:MAG: proline racemase family protein [Acidimicrobiia bacterium]|nr:proline racemase family protein [Acidimicrobiia bacterium]